MTGERRPILLILTVADGERLRGALTLACSEAALGGQVRLFLQQDAVALLAPPVVGPRDAAHLAVGLPDLCTILTDALDMGVEILVCQSGLLLAGLDAHALDPRILISGPVAVLAEVDAASRIVIA